MAGQLLYTAAWLLCLLAGAAAGIASPLDTVTAQLTTIQSVLTAAQQETLQTISDSKGTSPVKLNEQNCIES